MCKELAVTEDKAVRRLLRPIYREWALFQQPDPPRTNISYGDLITQSSRHFSYQPHTFYQHVRTSQRYRTRTSTDFGLRRGHQLAQNSYLWFSLLPFPIPRRHDKEKSDCGGEPWRPPLIRGAASRMCRDTTDDRRGSVFI